MTDPKSPKNEIHIVCTIERPSDSLHLNYSNSWYAWLLMKCASYQLQRNANYVLGPFTFVPPNSLTFAVDPMSLFILLFGLFNRQLRNVCQNTFCYTSNLRILPSSRFFLLSRCLTFFMLYSLLLTVPFVTYFLFFSLCRNVLSSTNPILWIGEKTAGNWW